MKAIKKTVIFLWMIVLCLFNSTQLVYAESEAHTFDKNATGSYEGFDYEFWIQNRGEDARMTLTGGGTFECEWNDVFNVLFRMGKKLDRTTPYHEYGDIILDYAAGHNIFRGNASYLCVYGWTEDPLVEWYIIESRGNYKPGGSNLLGTVELDGGIYQIYESTRIEQPSIQGTRTFQQYWSIRLDNRTEGIITISSHFKAWEEVNLDMSGRLYEVSLCLEGFRTSGNGRVTRHILTIGDMVFGVDTDLITSDEEPDEIEKPEEHDEIEKPGEHDEIDEPDDGGASATFPFVPVIAGVAVMAAVGGTAAVVIKVKAARDTNRSGCRHPTSK